MRTYPTFIEQQAAKGATFFTIITGADLTAAANTQTLSGMISQLGGNQMGLRVVSAIVVTPFTFSDASIVSCTVVVGDANSTNRYLTSLEISSAGGATAGYGVAGALAESAAYYTATAITADAVLTGTSAHNLSTCTGGELLVFWQVDDTRGIS